MSKLRFSVKDVEVAFLGQECPSYRNVQSKLRCWYYTPYLSREEAKTVWSGVNVELIFWLIRHQSRISKQLL